MVNGKKKKYIDFVSVQLVSHVRKLPTLAWQLHGLLQKDVNHTEKPQSCRCSCKYKSRETHIVDLELALVLFLQVS